ncbi:restin homolog isoform X2 [Diachasmimorpha longicaudata]|uniref:restin homolog isoform X2 n=1 Tax=Diachasmimorpha longicaudata TaxID=58733 RepID=UPI0030B87446
MSDSKASGLRPPSKIGRPCCNVEPKPAVPPSPPRSSMNSMEPIYENVRRKDTGGLRRGSDTSVVLTEDTDSFIIGDRVWVGGTKPGSIAYIGETQFAPGDWAGVVLDEPIGKNDGSVAGSRYFQCAPKHGIFSRLTRLTRYPLQESLMIQPELKTPPGNKSISPSLNVSMTSLSSTTSRDLKIGDRVIVSSSQGSKTGVLRYLGVTEFAAGEWCGVELDEPVGKNDGAVGDKRYFECKPRHGLFAPSHKVSRSPSSKRPSLSAVHKPMGASLNSSIRKAGSRESLTSVSSVTSATASARGVTTARRVRASTPGQSSLQEMLKEKQQEIDMLKKERDLERERITKAATQADNAEQSIVNLKMEYDKYREEMEKTVLDAQAALSRLLEEKNILQSQLEEEKHKCEDILFRFEEESVNKEDIQVVNLQNEERITALQKELSEERERVIQLENDNLRLFEAEEELVKLKAESNVLSEVENTNLCLKEAKITLENQMLERNNMISELSSQISELQQKLKNREEIEESHIEKLSENLSKTVEEKNAIISKITDESAAKTQALAQEIEKLKQIIETLTKENSNSAEAQKIELKKLLEENENLSVSNSQKIEDLMSQKLQVEQLLEEKDKLSVEKSRKIEEFEKIVNEKLQTIDQEKENSGKLLQKNSELEKLLENLGIEMNNLKIELTGKNGKLEETSQLIAELNDKFSAVSNNRDEKIIELERVGKLLEDQGEDNRKLVEEVKSNSGKFSSLNQEINSLKSELSEKIGEINSMTETMAELRDNITIFEQTKTNLESEMKMHESTISELNKRVKFSDEKIQELIAEKGKLEGEISGVISSCEGSSEQLKQYNEELRLKEKENGNLKEKIFELENSVESLSGNLRDNMENIGKIQEKLGKSEENERNLVAQLKENATNLAKLEEQLKDNENIRETLSGKLKEKEDELQQIQDNLKESEAKSAKLDEVEENLQKIEIKLRESEKNSRELQEKLKEAEGNLKLIHEELQKSSESSSKLVDEINSKNSKIEELTNKIENSEQNAAKLTGENEHLVKTISDLQRKTQTLEKNLEISTQLESSNVELRNSEENLKSKIEELNDKIRELIVKVDEKTSESSSLSSSLEAVSQEQQKSLDKIQELNNEIISLNSKLKSVKEGSEKLTKMLRKTEGLNSDLSQAAEALETTQNNYKISQEKIEELNSEVTSLKAQLILFDSTAHKLNELEEELSLKTEENSELSKKILELSTTAEEIKTLSSEKSRVEANVEKILEEKSGLEEKLKKSETVNEEMQNTLDMKSKMIDELVSVMETLKSSESESIKNLKLEFSQRLEESSENLSKANKELNAFKKTSELAELNLKSILEENETLKKSITSSEARIQDLESKKLEKTSELNTRSQKLEEKNAELNSRSKKLEEKNSELLMEKHNLEKKNLEMNSRLSEVLGEMKTLKENSNNNLGGLGEKIQSNGEAKNMKEILEDNETFKGQIDFLNSVIVDMQRKNESLKLKIEVLEMGVPASEADEYSRETLAKVSSPRMFCDICDEFDRHETEDCPKQAQDFEPEKPVKLTPVKGTVQRPYCEHCEVFGHDTTDCDDAETF